MSAIGKLQTLRDESQGETALKVELATGNVGPRALEGEGGKERKSESKAQARYGGKDGRETKMAAVRGVREWAPKKGRW